MECISRQGQPAHVSISVPSQPVVSESHRLPPTNHADGLTVACPELLGCYVVQLIVTVEREGEKFDERWGQSISPSCRHLLLDVTSGSSPSVVGHIAVNSWVITLLQQLNSPAGWTQNKLEFRFQGHWGGLLPPMRLFRKTSYRAIVTG